MAAVLEWTGDDEEPVPASFPSSQHRTRGRRTPARPGELPPDIEAAIWRGTELGSPVSSVLSSGFVALDAELPGAGWPCHSLTEILQPQPTVAEWRLLAPEVRSDVVAGQQIVVVGPLTVLTYRESSTPGSTSVNLPKSRRRRRPNASG